MIDAAFSLINLALLVAVLLLSFKGFPYALVSFAGYFLSMTAITTLLGVWINPGKEHQTYLTKMLTSAIGVGLLLAGKWIINQGGLVSLSFVGAETTLTLSFIAWITGFLGVLKGTHKSESIKEVLPDDDAPTNTPEEYQFQLAQIPWRSQHCVFNFSWGWCFDEEKGAYCIPVDSDAIAAWAGIDKEDLIQDVP